MNKRFEINSGMRGETLVLKDVHRKEKGGEQIRITPDLNVIKIGGHAAIDYGREVMYPLVEEIGELSKEHQTTGRNRRWGTGAAHHGCRDRSRYADRCTCGTFCKDL